MKIKVAAMLTLTLISGFISLAGDGNKETILQLGSRREIFVDHYLIDQLNGLQIVKHEPLDEGPVLYFDKQWEGIFSGYCTIIRDGANFRVYYRGLPMAGKDGTDLETTCVAESPDGIHWVKPNLKIYQINGSRKNNVVLANEAPSSHNFSPFLDTNPTADAGQRYKALAGEGKSGLMAYGSADGLHWKKLSKEAVFTKGVFDSQNVAFWSESEQCYLCYFRTWTEGGYKGFRSVSRTTSADFLHWTDPVPMTFGNTPLEHLYTQQTSPYFRAPHIYIAIGGRFMPNKQVLTDAQANELHVDPKYFKDCSDGYFMTSRGGERYDRTFMEAFIRPGIGLNNWVSRSNYPALNVVQTGPAEMSLYVNQDYAQPTAHLHRYSMRLDGFTSLRAPYEGGELTTRLFTFDGSQLELNYSTSAAGEIRLELQDPSGKPVPGFALEDAQPIIGNEIAGMARWKDKTKLGELAGKPIRMRIYIKDADLFSFRFK